MKIQLLIMLLAMCLIISCNEDPSCLDGEQNGDEIGIDCGGDCPACFTCDDGIMNGDETGIDCGGDCEDCTSCNDGIQNGNETGVDCGGNCTPCIILGCTDLDAHNYNALANQDDGSCETCDDGVFNGDEEGLDCGGIKCNSCPSVGDGGPAGGLIFFDKESYSNGWRYLEFGREIQGGDKEWGCRTNNVTSFIVGTGFENTENVINNYNNNNCTQSPEAFLACSNLQLNGFDDWYLPSANEMHKLYLYRNQLGLGDKRYWCSSELDAHLAYIVDYGGASNGVPHTYTWNKTPVNGEQGTGAVLAIRRF